MDSVLRVRSMTSSVRMDSTTLSKFVTVGLLTALIYYGCLILGVETGLFRPVPASALGYFVAVVFNYLMHSKWTYSKNVHHNAAVLRYLTMIVGGFILNIVVMVIGINTFEYNYILVQTGAIAIVTVFNLFASSYLVFRNQD